MKITLGIAEATPSLNQFRRHWTRLYRLQAHWDKNVRDAIERWVYDDAGTGHLAASQVVARTNALVPRGRRRVTIIRSGPRLLDKDNFWGGCKVVWDSLRLRATKQGDFRGNHVIMDDTLAMLEHGEHQQVKGPPGTVIIIENIQELPRKPLTEEPQNAP